MCVKAWKCRSVGRCGRSVRKAWRGSVTPGQVEAVEVCEGVEHKVCENVKKGKM